MEKKEAVYTLIDELLDIKEALNKARLISSYLYQDYFSGNENNIINNAYLYEQAKIAFDVVSDYVFKTREIVEKLLEKQKNSPTTVQSK